MAEVLDQELAQAGAQFEALIADDSVVNFGLLQEVLSGALSRSSLFICTLERLVQNEGIDFRIETDRRYSYHRGYVERLLKDSGLQPNGSSHA